MFPFILAHIIVRQQTHQKDAVVRHQAYAGLPSMVPTVQRKEPYTLSVDFDVVTDITQDRKRNLIDAVEREIGESVRIDHDSITSHKSAHFYGHFLRPGNGVALRVPSEYPKVRQVIAVLGLFITDLICFALQVRLTEEARAMEQMGTQARLFTWPRPNVHREKNRHQQQPQTIGLF
jgi:hypothetical protein